MPFLEKLKSSFNRSPPPYSNSHESFNSCASNMGNCHSSNRYTTEGSQHIPRDIHEVASKQSYHSPMPTGHHYQHHQKQQQQGQQTLWAPPPYASELTINSNASASSDSPYAFLREFDTIFLVDDSTSMVGSRWHEAEDAIAAIAPICTQYDGDGIEIYFLNHQRRLGPGSNSNAYTNISTADAVREIFRSVKPRGATPVGRRLHQILHPYMRRLSLMTAQCEEQSVKPLNIIVITDGVFTDDAESVIVRVAKQLDEPGILAVPWQVGIQFFQVGDDEPARRHLQALDDELGKMSRNEKLRDIVDTVTWKGDRGRTLNAEGILKCVLGAVNRKYDKKDASR